VVEEAVVLIAVAAVVVVAFAVAAAVVAPSFPGVSPLFLDASPDVLAASVHAYLPWCLPFAASYSSEQQPVGQLRLVED
jgi:hypothetical protein